METIPLDQKEPGNTERTSHEPGLSRRFSKESVCSGEHDCAERKALRVHRLGAVLAVLGSALCLVALFVPFDHAVDNLTPPVEITPIVPVVLFSTHPDWALWFWCVPSLLGVLVQLAWGIRAWWNRATISAWGIGISLASLGWMCGLFLFDWVGWGISGIDIVPGLGFWLLAVGFLLGCMGTSLSRRAHDQLDAAKPGAG